MALVPAPEFSFGPFAVGDTVTGPAVVPYLEDDDPADFAGAELGEAWVYWPDGTEHPADVELGGNPDELAYTLDGEPFTDPGLYALAAQIVAGTNTVRLASAAFVVELVNDGWGTIAGMRAGWRDAPASDVTVWRLLEVAKAQVLEYAPARWSEAGTRPSVSLVTAQGMQARNNWNAAKTDPANEGIGGEGFVIRPYPMDWTIKNIIRPINPRPVVR